MVAGAPAVIVGHVVGILTRPHPGRIHQFAVAGGGRDWLLKPGEQAVRILGVGRCTVGIEAGGNLGLVDPLANDDP